MTSRKSTATVSIRIEQQVCFALHAAARTYDGLYRELLAPYHLSYPQYLVMIVVGESGPLGVKDIGASLRLDSGTLSPLLKRLESAGLVERLRDAADERRVSVSLTPAGRRTLRDVGGVPAQVAEASGMSMKELRSLMALLRNTTTAVDLQLGQLKASRTNRP
ncbi:MAG: MarR family transcriptional regulator, organic hydroperoxide resistance regulator [Actinomycetota bacterium]|jgi:DNA-binding MarR family transcriptional regulator|nr:MarR family transcriptional regulator, organic hydroperoxide resistance regulator [Actinomycetota bacterium]